jgi:O-antigen ligase
MAALHPRHGRLRARTAELRAGGEHVFAFLAVLVLAGPFLPLLRAGTDAAGEESASPVRVALVAAVYAGTLALVAARPREVAQAALRNPLVPALVALAAASYFWSEAPGLTLRRTMALAATTLFGLWLAARFSRRELLGILAAVLGVSAVASLALGLLSPELGRSAEFDGAWLGVFGHKNGMGKAMVLAALVLLVRAPDAAPGRGARAALLLGIAALVVLSRSTSSLVALAAVAALVPLLRALAARNLLLLLAAPVAVCAGAVLAGGTGAGAASMAGALGKDATLTGRTELWGAVLASIGKRAGLGYGYGAFWHTAEESESLFAAIGWGAWHAHNAFLDAWLNLGLVGVVLLVAALAWAGTRAVRDLRAGSGPDAAWPLAFLAFTVMTNLTESRLLEPGTLYWALFVAVACAPFVAAERTAERPAPAAAAAGPVSPGVRRAARSWRRAGQTGIVPVRPAAPYARHPGRLSPGPPAHALVVRPLGALVQRRDLRPRRALGRAGVDGPRRPRQLRHGGAGGGAGAVGAARRAGRGPPARRGLLRPGPVRRRWAEHLAGTDRRFDLWSVLMFQAWLEHGRRAAPSAPASDPPSAAPLAAAAGAAA